MDCPVCSIYVSFHFAINAVWVSVYQKGNGMEDIVTYIENHTVRTECKSGTVKLKLNNLGNNKKYKKSKNIKYASTIGSSLVTQFLL